MALMKLLMTWDIVPGREQEYVEFNAREFVPRLMKLGLRPTDSWFTLYGDAPQLTVGWVAEDAELIRQALESDDWRQLQRQLRDLVTNFRYRVVPATGLFQM